MKMSRLCRQVSIESPGSKLQDSVLSFEIPIPEVPPSGARIRVAYAGACYRLNRTRSASICSTSSMSSLITEFDSFGVSQNTVPAHTGIRDGALFPGYEVAGVVEKIGYDAAKSEGIKEGTRIVLYPDEGVPHGYAEYIIVPDFKCLVTIPDNLPLSVAAMLPTGALLAMNTVYTAIEIIQTAFSENESKTGMKVLVVGTGGLALWALRIITHLFENFDFKNKIRIAVACIKDEGLELAKESDTFNIVQWSEDLYENQLIERTKDACQGPVDIVINFGTNPRSLQRSLQCLAQNGVVLITENVGENLVPKFSSKAEALNASIVVIPNGSIAQLRELVQLVGNGKVEPPPHTVFPVEEASDVIRKLCNSEINGRAILKFYNID